MSGGGEGDDGFSSAATASAASAAAAGAASSAAASGSTGGAAAFGTAPASGAATAGADAGEADYYSAATSQPASTTVAAVPAAAQQQGQGQEAQQQDVAANNDDDGVVRYSHDRRKTSRKRKNKSSVAPSVLVLGAGIAGLACARELKHRGYHVLVVEARTRPGGRLKGGEINLASPTSADDDNDQAGIDDGDDETRQPQHDVDLGGALIHGIQNNPLTSLARDIGMPTQPVGDCLLLDNNGWPVDPKDDERASKNFNECLEESFRRCRMQQQQQQQRAQQKQQQRQDKEPGNAKIASAQDGIESDVAGKGGGEEVDSFGDVFAEVCREKSVNAYNHLFRWHQANLELSCGASFPDLGRKWNEDEAYGFDGDHVALRHSWRPVVEAMADGVDILYQSPVKLVHIVQPDPEAVLRVQQKRLAQLQQKELAQQLKQQEQEQQQQQQQQRPEKKRRRLIKASTTASSSTAEYSSMMSSRRRVSRSPTPVPSPTRMSRRLRGEDASDTRRSLRQNKGQPVTRYTVEAPPPAASAASSGGLSHKRAKGRSGRDEQSLDKLPKRTIVQVTLQNGTVLEADHVVCALPLGILKLNKDDRDGNKDGQRVVDDGTVFFDPPLPVEKRRAIQRLGTGLLNKCALSFDRVFWQDIDFLGLAHNADNSYLILNGHIFTGKPILVFLFGGSRAKEIEDWTDADIVEDCMSVLKRICGSSKLHTGTSGGHQRLIPDPIDYRVTRWGHEQYSRMAFTYIPPGVDGFTELRAMSQPIKDTFIVGDSAENEIPTIMFAGEHTTPYHPSTIHGAFLSGIREAYRLDCTLYPQANGIRFTDKELYGRTFLVDRRFSGDDSAPVRPPLAASEGSADVVLTGDNISSNEEVNEESASTGTNAPRRQHRRRGTAMVMNLRPRPAAVDGDSCSDRHVNGMVASNNVAAPPPQPQGTRRSSRAAAMAKMTTTGVETSGYIPGEDTLPTNLSTVADGEVGQVRDFFALESDTLLRGMESYGRDSFEYLQQMVVPVPCRGGALDDDYSESQSWTADQVRKRCNWLKPEMRKRVSKSSNAWRSWVAKTVYESSTNPELLTGTGTSMAIATMTAVKASTKYMNGTDSKSKKKRTESSKQKQIRYNNSSYDQITPAKKKLDVSTATRSGRKVYKPQALTIGSLPTVPEAGKRSADSTGKEVVAKTRFGRVVRKPDASS